jgi:iron complex outermembrane receptor protein
MHCTNESLKAGRLGMPFKMASVTAAVLSAFAGGAAHAQSTSPSANPNTLETIVISGFKKSLDKALSDKRESVSSVDVIVAEDIAKFPDQNIAESLQRIPGISIQKDAGEGSRITVRGLSSQFTRVRVNGMETIATSTEGASANRDRGFDFNVFASELFSSLVVHKTAEASLDEGSLGAVVDLNTGNPLSGKKGFTVVGSAQAARNTLSKNTGPRLAGLINWKSDGGTMGASVSGAYSKTKTLELGNNTTQWQQARFDSVNGVPCFFASATSAVAVPNIGGTYRSSTGCDAVALAFHPRIPRYGEVKHDRERAGVTASWQWRPADGTKVTVDALGSSFKETREERWGEVLLRTNERSVDVSNYAIDTNNNLYKATLNDAYVRTEHYLRKSETRFGQLDADWDQDITDKFRFTLQGGVSRSDAKIPLETTIMLDNRAATNYSYDYSNSRSPVLAFGTNMLDPSTLQLAEIRDRPSDVLNKYRTAQVRTEWDVTDWLTAKSGLAYRRFSFTSVGNQRDTFVCPSSATAARDVVLGTITCSPNTTFGPTAVYGFPATAALTETFNLGNAGQPSGTTTSWLVANLNAATAFTNLYGRALTPTSGTNFGVVEATKTAYLQFDAKNQLAGLKYAVNLGTRYARTDQSSNGPVNGVDVHLGRVYGDWLPSANLAIFPTDKLIFRGAVAKVITRPGLSNLSPSGSIDGRNYTITFGNPKLDPFRATAYDLSGEWYFAPQSIFSVALFDKDIKSFPVTTSTVDTFASTGLPLSAIPSGTPASVAPEAQPWIISQPTNGTGATLKGVEIAVQAPFSFLPGILKNFGGIANVTFVNSSAVYGQTPPSVVPGVSPVAQPFSGTLVNVSKRAYNLTIYYEDDKFSARASYSYRSPYADSTGTTGNIFQGFNATRSVDASTRYKINDMVEVSLEGTNLTDAYRDRYVDTPTNRIYEYNHFGRTISIGARFKM